MPPPQDVISKWLAGLTAFGAFAAQVPAALPAAVRHRAFTRDTAPTRTPVLMSPGVERC